jgi:hypothetical protein
VIRNAILHLLNEQPLLADLFEAPLPGDIGLRCTNLRQMNGKRPAFVENSASVYFFPYAHMRFIEIQPGTISGDASLAVTTDGDEERQPAPPVAEAEPDLEIDEDFLRRIREV